MARPSGFKKDTVACEVCMDVMRWCKACVPGWWLERGLFSMVSLPKEIKCPSYIKRMKNESYTHLIYLLVILQVCKYAPESHESIVSNRGFKMDFPSLGWVRVGLPVYSSNHRSPPQGNTFFFVHFRLACKAAGLG